MFFVLINRNSSTVRLWVYRNSSDSITTFFLFALTDYQNNNKKDVFVEKINDFIKDVLWQCARDIDRSPFYLKNQIRVCYIFSFFPRRESTAPVWKSKKNEINGFSFISNKRCCLLTTIIFFPFSLEENRRPLRCEKVLYMKLMGFFSFQTNDVIFGVHTLRTHSGLYEEKKREFILHSTTHTLLITKISPII